MARGVEHGECILPAAEEARGEEGVELGHEGAAIGGLGHAEVSGRAAERDEVACADGDCDAVAELGADLERLGAAREARELDDVAVAAAAGLGTERLQKQAFGEQRKLSSGNKQSCQDPIDKRFLPTANTNQEINSCMAMQAKIRETIRGCDRNMRRIET